LHPPQRQRAQVADIARPGTACRAANALAHIAHREDHHPDLGVHYDRAIVRFSTHDVGGLSENDFICAAKAEQLEA
jgi:pterin-4a-carbinolamine dehydratase